MTICFPIYYPGDDPYSKLSSPYTSLLNPYGPLCGIGSNRYLFEDGVYNLFEDGIRFIFD